MHVSPKYSQFLTRALVAFKKSRLFYTHFAWPAVLWSPSWQRRALSDENGSFVAAEEISHGLHHTFHKPVNVLVCWAFMLQSFTFVILKHLELDFSCLMV